MSGLSVDNKPSRRVDTFFRLSLASSFLALGLTACLRPPETQSTTDTEKTAALVTPGSVRVKIPDGQCVYVVDDPSAMGRIIGGLQRPAATTLAERNGDVFEGPEIVIFPGESTSDYPSGISNVDCPSQ